MTTPEEFLKSKITDVESLSKLGLTAVEVIGIDYAQEYADLYYKHQLAQAAKELPTLSFKLDDGIIRHPDESCHPASMEDLEYDRAMNKAALIIARMQQEKAALQAFKDYVHSRLDEAGIEKNPNGEHSKAGCRIGDRLDIALQEKEQEAVEFAKWIAKNGWESGNEMWEGREFGFGQKMLLSSEDLYRQFREEKGEKGK